MRALIRGSTIRWRGRRQLDWERPDMVEAFAASVRRLDPELHDISAVIARNLCRRDASEQQRERGK